MSEFLETALRAYAVPVEHKVRKSRARRSFSRPDFMLVLDTETTLDQTQRLTFGDAKLYQKRPRASGHNSEDWALLDEVLFHADDARPEEIETLRSHVRNHGGKTQLFLRPRVLSMRAFVEQMLWQWGYKGRALVVGFNLPFDLSRPAVAWGTARGRYAGGFSLELFDYSNGEQAKSNRYRPRLMVQKMDSKRQFMAFGKPAQLDSVDRIPEGARDGRPDKKYSFQGHFLDLRTLAFALTNSSHSLSSACEAFHVERGKLDYSPTGQISDAEIEYCRRDVDATFGLACRLFAEFDAHPISPDFRPERHTKDVRAAQSTVQITKAFSPASVAKGYLRAMGLRPFLERADLSDELLGLATSAFFGGRAEIRIRRHVVPVTYCDFLSMYPTVNALMGLAAFLRAEHVTTEECTEEVQALLDSVAVADCFEPSLWTRLPAFAEIQPDGDHLPVRAAYGDGSRDWQIGVNPFSSEHPHWYALPDLLSAKLRTGRTPIVKRAFRLVAHGTASGLRPVHLRGAIRVDPREDDLFRMAIEERNRLPDKNSKDGQFLKVLSNSGSYGIFGEWNRQELPARQRVEVDVSGPLGQFRTKVGAPETMGEYCFPPIAAVITSAARLMLMLLEASVAELGGSYAMCDTDSMAIVSTESGGLLPCPGGAHALPGGAAAIRALSWVEVEQIRERFSQLNPYDRTVVPGSILKIEDENFGAGDRALRRQLYIYGISAKRYALFNLDEQGEPVIRKYSEHGLGHLLNPINAESDDRDWIRQVWELMVRDALGLEVSEPSWVDRPAMSRITASSPVMLRPFAAYNAGKSYADQVKPFNFVLSAHVAPLGHPARVDPGRFHLIAPYTSDSRQWRKLRWTDLHSGKRYGITTSGHASGSRVRVQSYRDVLRAYRAHPESKSSDPDGGPCREDSAGLLGFRHVGSLGRPVLIGKESNRLDDVRAGLVHDPVDVYTEYSSRDHDAWSELVLPTLLEIPRSELARRVGISGRQLSEIRQGRARPRPEHRHALERLAIEFAHSKLPELREAATPNLRTLAQYLAGRSLEPKRCIGCGAPLNSTALGARYCSGACRQRSYRARRNTENGTGPSRC